MRILLSVALLTTFGINAAFAEQSLRHRHNDFYYGSYDTSYQPEFPKRETTRQEKPSKPVTAVIRARFHRPAR